MPAECRTSHTPSCAPVATVTAVTSVTPGPRLTLRDNVQGMRALSPLVVLAVWGAGCGPLAAAAHGSGELSEQDPRSEQIVCGPIRIRWSSGGYVYFEDDRALELAPTQAATIAAVDPDAPSCCG